MRAISLWQPWATLVVNGAKRIETRHWPAPADVLGQRIAIHATLRTTELDMAMEEPFNRYVKRDRLPLGAVVGTVVVDRCSIITFEKALELEERNWHEFCFGNYEPGRYAWVLRDPEPLAEPVSFTGRQKWFDVPDALVVGTIQS